MTVHDIPKDPIAAVAEAAVGTNSTIKVANGTNSTIKTAKKLSDLPEVATTDDVADVLQMTANGLHQARLAGKDPRYIKIGRLVRYLRADVLDYLQRNRFEPQPPPPPVNGTTSKPKPVRQ